MHCRPLGNETGTLAPFTRLRPLPRHQLVHFLRKGRGAARVRWSLSESLTGRAARCLVGGWSRAAWPAGLYPSPADQDSLSVSWRAPARAGAAEYVSESWAEPAAAAWGKGSRSVLGCRRPPGRRGPGSLVRVLSRPRCCRLGQGQSVRPWSSVSAGPPRPGEPSQV